MGSSNSLVFFPFGSSGLASAGKILLHSNSHDFDSYDEFLKCLHRPRGFCICLPCLQLRRRRCAQVADQYGSGIYNRVLLRYLYPLHRGQAGQSFAAFFAWLSYGFIASVEVITNTREDSLACSSFDCTGEQKLGNRR